MKIRKSLVMVVVLFAFASLMAAMAYNTAVIDSEGTLTVSATDDALLALIPEEGVGNEDVTADVNADGVLTIDFGKSGYPNNGTPGLQPGSTYTWNKLMKIWNKSAEDLDVTIDVPEDMAEYLTIKGADEAGWYRDLPVFVDGRSVTFTLKANYTIPLAFTIELDEDAELETIDGDITVTAEAK